MRDVLTLTGLELRALYGINKALHTKDPKAKKRNGLMAGVWAFLIVVVMGYMGGLVYGLCTLGLADVVPAYLTVLASLLIFAFGIFRAGHAIFGARGYDILSAMPLRAGAIVVSRFIAMYAEDLLLTLVILLPGTIVFGVCRQPGWFFYAGALVGGLFIPAIPLVVSTLFGTVIMAVSARMKHKSLVQTLLMIALVVGMVCGSFTMGEGAESMTVEAVAALAQNLGSALTQYPPAAWMNHVLIGGQIGELLLFALLSLLLMVGTILLTARFFHAIMRRLMTFSARHAYTIGAMETRGLLKTLYLREAKRYFSSSIYVTNTIVGPIMACIMAVGLWTAGMDALTAVFPAEFDVAPLLPFAFGAVMCMMPTTCASISMEGKQFWVIQSLPIPAKTLLDAKILLNLTLMLPFCLVGEVFLMLSLRPSLLDMLWLLMMSGALMIFCAVLGITVNLRFHRFDWAKEEEVVKQGVSTLLGGFAGVLLAFLMGGAVFVTPAAYADLAKLLLTALLLAGTFLLYRKNNAANLSQL